MYFLNAQFPKPRRINPETMTKRAILAPDRSLTQTAHILIISSDSIIKLLAIFNPQYVNTLSTNNVANIINK